MIGKDRIRFLLIVSLRTEERIIWNASLGIIPFEIVCTSASRTYRLHGVRIILRDRDPGVAQDLD